MDKRNLFDLLEVLLSKPIVSKQDVLKSTKMSKHVFNESVKHLQYDLQKINANLSYHEKIDQLVMEVGDYNKLEVYYRTLQNACIDTLSQQERIRQLLIKLLSSTQYFKIEQLADFYYVSPRQISKDLRIIRGFLETYDIEILSVPHYGLTLTGTELNKRICLAGIYSQNITSQIQINEKTSKKNQEMIDEIRGIVSEVLRKYEYTISDIMFENLIVHLFVVVLRIKNGDNIQLDNNKNTEDELMISKEIVLLLSKKFHIEFSKEECSYISAHLESKRYYDTEYSENIPAEIGDLVIEFLKRIDIKYHTNLRSDFQLCMILSLHCMSLLQRIKYGLKQKNPLLEEIKTRFIYEFDLAIEGCKTINERYQCELDENEIGYFALDIRLSLEKRTSNRKYNVVLVCSTGRGSAHLLKMKLLESFARYIKKLELCSSRDVNMIGLDDYDYVFTTVPLFVKTRTPILRISCFLGEQDIVEIHGIFESVEPEQKALKYFEKNLFMGVCDFKNKIDALEQMTNHIRKSKEIPDRFLECVLAREETATTSFGNKVAFPHPNELLTEETFVCIAILKKPILWGTSKVQIIFLASIENSSEKQLQDFYKMLAKIINNSKNVDRLIHNPVYDTLSQLIFDEL